MSLRIRGEHGEATVLHELPMRRLFDNLESGTFVLELERDTGGEIVRVTFRGAGWGHGVGMCQMGAIGRAEASHSYRDILAAYYGGAATQALYGIARSP